MALSIYFRQSWHRDTKNGDRVGHQTLRLKYSSAYNRIVNLFFDKP